MDLCKAAAKYALKKEYIKYDQLSAVKGKRDPKRKVVTLTKDEVKKWIAYQHTNAKTQLCADIFALQCFTGLSYIDVYNYMIETDEDGITWITNGRVKNDNQYSVMLNQYSKEILQKYNWSIPAISNQKYNEKLKDIADILGIKKHITTHIGRKTFATLNAINGFGTGSLMDMLGHTKEDTTNTYYINVGRDRIKKEAERLGYPDLLGKTA
jgi:integrase/recombinase XerD